MTPTDGVLREAVRRALAADHDTLALDVRVGVLRSVVHLAGEAPSERLWHQAGTVAASVAGVRGVVNRIEAPGAPRPSRIISFPLGEQGRVTQ